ncbi:MAG: phage portal protein, partial [Clostridia bacterium]|nr:phage portal protein [Clostridia bacterium]
MAEKKHPLREVGVRIIKAAGGIAKADAQVQLVPEDAANAGDWISHPVDMRGLCAMVDNSAILPQCIRAYKNNIVGFGLGVRYRDDVEETPEMAAEFDRLGEILELLNTEQDTKEVFEDVIEARETYGVAYLEVIRNMAGEVVQIEFVRDTPSVTKTRPLEPYIATAFRHHGQETERRKKYCKYRQQLGGKTVYFREFGDPRIMDRRDGQYLGEGETLDLKYQANEIMEFAIGTEPYGKVRWIGQVLGVDGSRRAENLNNNYFINGRHTPLMIMVENGTLTDESFEKLQHYMNDIKGEAGQHAFIVLESESIEGRTGLEETGKPSIQVKDLAGILQKDELFQDYIDNTRRKVQSAFQLPDIYTGYTTDFNRATAQTAQEVTEKQVFQPERKSLAWAINNRLLNDYNFRYVEAYFLEPNISNPDDEYKMLTVLNNAGGVTMNMA